MYKTYGFKDKSDMVRTALYALCQELETQLLAESAILYAELYDEDAALQALTELAVVGWPE
jgi:hypothetical protein